MEADLRKLADWEVGLLESFDRRLAFFSDPRRLEELEREAIAVVAVASGMCHIDHGSPEEWESLCLPPSLALPLCRYRLGRASAISPGGWPRVVFTDRGRSWVGRGNRLKVPWRRNLRVGGSRRFWLPLGQVPEEPQWASEWAFRDEVAATDEWEQVFPGEVSDG